MRVAIYTRVSTEAQAEEEVPIAAQITECESFAASKGWTVVAVFKDEGISGRTDARRDFQQMIALAKQQPRPFDNSFVWKSNRLSRRVEHALVYKSMLRRRGIRVVSVKEPEIPGAIQMLVETIIAAVDEFLCIQIGEYTLRGQKEIARSGYSAGGRPPRGLRSVKKVVGLKRNGEPMYRTAWEANPFYEMIPGQKWCPL